MKEESVKKKESFKETKGDDEATNTFGVLELGQKTDLCLGHT